MSYADKIWDHLTRIGQVTRLWNYINFSETTCLTIQVIFLISKNERFF